MQGQRFFPEIATILDLTIRGGAAKQMFPPLEAAQDGAFQHGPENVVHTNHFRHAIDGHASPGLRIGGAGPAHVLEHFG